MSTRSLTNKSPGAGQDMLLASANNLYDGVSTADLQGFNEQFPLNSRLVKRDGALHEEVYRIDGDGRYADSLGRSSGTWKRPFRMRRSRWRRRSRR